MYCVYDQSVVLLNRQNLNMSVGHFSKSELVTNLKDKKMTSRHCLGV